MGAILYSPSSSLSNITKPLLRPRSESINTYTNTTNSPNNNNDHVPLKSLHRRYQTVSIPATAYGRQTSSPPPGTVVGIIIGTVFGFILVLYLLFLIFGSPRLRPEMDENGDTLEVRENGYWNPRAASLFGRRRAASDDGGGPWAAGGGWRDPEGRRGGGDEEDQYVDVFEEPSIEERRPGYMDSEASHTQTTSASDGNTVEVMEEPPPAPRPPPPRRRKSMSKSMPRSKSMSRSKSRSKSTRSKSTRRGRPGPPPDPFGID